MTVAGVLLLATAATAFAESNDDEHNGKDESIAAVNAPISLGRAIATAEGETGGRALEAAYETMNNTTVVEVELAKDKGIVTARVDASSGKVLATGQAQDQQDDAE